jgi:hypothetical protein
MVFNIFNKFAAKIDKELKEKFDKSFDEFHSFDPDSQEQIREILSRGEIHYTMKYLQGRDEEESAEHLRKTREAIDSELDQVINKIENSKKDDEKLIFKAWTLKFMQTFYLCLQSGNDMSIEVASMMGALITEPD